MAMGRGWRGRARVGWQTCMGGKQRVLSDDVCTVQTGCGCRRRERGWHDAWLTWHMGTSRPGRWTGGQTCKPTA